MTDDRIDFGPLDPTADPVHFEGIMREITERAADQLAMRRARSSVVGQIPQWRRPMLAAAAITALISGAVIWQTAERHAPENSVGIAEALGVPAQVARWVRADSTPTPAQLLTALGETP